MNFKLFIWVVSLSTNSFLIGHNESIKKIILYTFSKSTLNYGSNEFALSLTLDYELYLFIFLLISSSSSIVMFIPLSSLMDLVMVAVLFLWIACLSKGKGESWLVKAIGDVGPFNACVRVLLIFLCFRCLNVN